jgi:hypothetical protein
MAEVEQARAMYQQRRLREKLFPDGARLFGEPAWDMLLDLFIAHQEDRAVRVTSACIGACAAPTTGLRWLASLEQNGLVRCWQEERDKRTRRVALTPTAVEIMLRYFGTL